MFAAILEFTVVNRPFRTDSMHGRCKLEVIDGKVTILKYSGRNSAGGKAIEDDFND